MMYKYKIKEVVKVVDGDTIDVVIDLGFSVFVKERIRLYGVNAAEIRTKNLEEKVIGIEAKNWLENKLKNQNLVIQTFKEEKYGRMLGNIFIENEEVSINTQMVNNHIAERYFP